MLIIIEGLIGKRCLVYIDDILIFVENRKEQEESLKSIEKRLYKYNLIIKEKYLFMNEKK